MKYKVSIQESSLTDDFDIFIEISEPFNVSVKRKCKDQELLKMYKENPQDVDKIFEDNKDKFTLYEMILQKQSGNYVYKSLNVIK